MTNAELKQVWGLLPADVQLEIDMILYDEFNSHFCSMEEYMDEIYTHRDLSDLSEAEKSRKKELVWKYVTTCLFKEWCKENEGRAI